MYFLSFGDQRHYPGGRWTRQRLGNRAIGLRLDCVKQCRVGQYYRGCEWKR
jgi:hypothetical protein